MRFEAESVLFFVFLLSLFFFFFFFFQAEDGIRDLTVTGVQTCALPISGARGARTADCLPFRPRAAARSARVPTCRADSGRDVRLRARRRTPGRRSEEHTSELQSQSNLVCRLLLEKKKKKQKKQQANDSQ